MDVNEMRDAIEASILQISKFDGLVCPGKLDDFRRAARAAANNATTVIETTLTLEKET